MFDSNFLGDALVDAARSVLPFIGYAAAAGVVVLSAMLGLRLAISALRTVGDDTRGGELSRGDEGYEGSYWAYQNGDYKL